METSIELKAVVLENSEFEKRLKTKILQQFRIFGLSRFQSKEQK